MIANRDSTHRIHNLPNRHIREDTRDRNDRTHSQRVAEVVVAVDGRQARGVLVLPDAEVVVDERVVHPEDRVAGGGGDVGHDGADAVVTVCVGSVSSLSVSGF